MVNFPTKMWCSIFPIRKPWMNPGHGVKRIIITWAILNGLGFIMAYITPFFAGGQWNG